MAAEWWDPTGKFKPLHKFNPVRLQYIRDRRALPITRDYMIEAEERYRKLGAAPAKAA